MKQFYRRLIGASLVLAASLTPAIASADPIDISTLFTNFGFESGNLSGWSVTRPNTTNYVASLSPQVNPIIDPADPGNIGSILTAPVGDYFTGILRPGDLGSDLAFKLAHNAVAISALTGDTFQVTLYANRGRLEPFDTPSSTADVGVRIFGWTAGAAPTVTPSTDNWSRTIGWNPGAQNFNFTLLADGTWGAQTFTFNPAAMGIDAANLRYLSFAVTGSTHNHDQYVAIDTGSRQVTSVPEPASLLLTLMGLGSVAGSRLRKRRSVK